MDTYEVVEFRFDRNHERHQLVIESGLTLDEAQEHCNRDDTSGTDEGGPWFHGYRAE